MSTTTAHSRETETEPKLEVLLAPRVVDERAFRSLSERLREMVERAEKAEETLAVTTGRGGELLSSLEAMAHTQTRRAREIRESIESSERRIGAFDAKAMSALAEEITRAGAEAVENAERARAAVELSVGVARREAAAIIEQTATRAPEPVAETRQAFDDAALTALVERAENAVRRVQDTAGQLDGLKQQTESLLSAMRSTILECAEARDAAEARLDRLSTLTTKADAAIAMAEARVAQAEESAARVRVPEPDLDPIVREVARRVMEAVDGRVATALERAAAPPAPAETSGNETVDEALAEIRRSIGLVSDVTDAMRAVERPLAGDIPSACAQADAARARRLAAPPLGASGEMGDPAQTRTLWSWSQDELRG